MAATVVLTTRLSAPVVAAAVLVVLVHQTRRELVVLVEPAAQYSVVNTQVAVEAVARQYREQALSAAATAAKMARTQQRGRPILAAVVVAEA
jgi:cell division protein FtsL